MSTLSTANINWLAGEWENSYSSAVLSGIVGDLAHKARGGYHISREDQPNDNYSVIRADDKPGNGPSDRAAAIDMTMSTADIIKCHKRLRVIYQNRAKDPRMKYINAWNGWDGEGDAGRYDVVKGTIDTASADHKWHIHLEIRRKYVNDKNAMIAILSMLKGESLETYQGDDDMTKEEWLALLKTDEGKDAVANAVWNRDGVIPKVGNPAPGKNPDGTTINTHWAGTTYLQNIYAAALAARDAAGDVDEAAIANALVTNAAFVNALSAAITAKLPSGVQVTPDQLTSAVKTALRDGVAK